MQGLGLRTDFWGSGLRGCPKMKSFLGGGPHYQDYLMSGVYEVDPNLQIR